MMQVQLFPVKGLCQQLLQMILLWFGDLVQTRSVDFQLLDHTFRLQVLNSTF